MSAMITPIIGQIVGTIHVEAGPKPWSTTDEPTHSDSMAEPPRKGIIPMWN